MATIAVDLLLIKVITSSSLMQYQKNKLIISNSIKFTKFKICHSSMLKRITYEEETYAITSHITVVELNHNLIAVQVSTLKCDSTTNQ